MEQEKCECGKEAVDTYAKVGSTVAIVDNEGIMHCTVTNGGCRKAAYSYHADVNYHHEVIEDCGFQYCKHCGLFPENFHRPCSQDERDKWVQVQEYFYKDQQ